MAEFKFGFEEIWFRLIIKHLPGHPDLFSPKNSEHAQTLLRAGKLKVVAAKVWAESAGVIERNKNHFVLSRLGKIIAKNDPTLEEDGVWWAIHYNLARKSSPAWFYSFYFNLFEADDFNRAEFERDVRDFWDQSHDNPMTDKVFDKLIFSPFRQVFENTRLGNEFGFFYAGNSSAYARKPPDDSAVHPAIVSYALLDYASENSRQSVHFEKLMGPWGVGRIFRLSHESLDRLLVNIGERYNKAVAWISHTANLNSVSFMAVPPLALIAAYYYELDGMQPQAALESGIKDLQS